MSKLNRLDQGKRFILSFIFLCFFFPVFFLFACDSPEVKQIEVNVPEGVQVPEEMVYIPAGEFIMGHAEEARTKFGQKVYSEAYLIDRYEVSYSESLEYCQTLDKRLPTEIEWEKAARGTDGRKWPWEIFVDHPNNGFSGFMSEPVNKRKEWISPYGVYGMGHNVWEWIGEEYIYSGQPEHERDLFKVLRGGLLQTHITIKFSPTYFRNWMDPASKLNFIGFRCAKSVD